MMFIKAKKHSSSHHHDEWKKNVNQGLMDVYFAELNIPHFTMNLNAALTDSEDKLV